MKGKIVTGIFVVLLAVVSSGYIKAQASDARLTTTLSLEQAYETALKTGSEVEVARLGINRARAKLKWADHVADGIDSDSMDTYEKGKTKIFVPAQAESELLLAENKLKQTEAQFEIEVERVYYSVVKARKALEYAKDSYKKAEEQLEIVNDRFKASSTAKNEVLEAEVQVANAKSALVGAENEETVALMKLNQILEKGLNTPLNLTDQLIYTPPPEINLDEEMEKALDKRFDIIQARETVNVKRVESQVADSFYGSGVYVYEDGRYSLLQAESELKEKLKSAEVSIKTAYLDMLTLDQQYQLAGKSLQQAQEAVRLAETRYKAGLAKNIDVTSAMATLSQAQSKLTDVLYQYSLSKAQLVFELGQY